MGKPKKQGWDTPLSEAQRRKLVELAKSVEWKPEGCIHPCPMPGNTATFLIDRGLVWWMNDDLLCGGFGTFYGITHLGILVARGIEAERKRG